MTQVSQETMMFKRNNENKDVSQTISEVCKALEEKGYVRRRQDEKDKRFKYVYLTEQGQQARDRLLHISEVWIQALTRNMDERMLASTLQGLQQAAQNAAVLTWDARDGEMEG